MSDATDAAAVSESVNLRGTDVWYVANESFITESGGVYGKGFTRVRKGDPILDIAPALFSPIITNIQQITS